jgi:hypothetical protein
MFVIDRTTHDLLYSNDYNMWPRGIYAFIADSARDLQPLFALKDWRCTTRCRTSLDRHPVLDAHLPTARTGEGRRQDDPCSPVGCSSDQLSPGGRLALSIGLDSALVQSLNTEDGAA